MTPVPITITFPLLLRVRSGSLIGITGLAGAALCTPQQRSAEPVCGCYNMHALCDVKTWGWIKEDVTQAIHEKLVEKHLDFSARHGQSLRAGLENVSGNMLLARVM